jgi:hypothetical protein
LPNLLAKYVLLHGDAYQQLPMSCTADEAGEDTEPSDNGDVFSDTILAW